MRKPFLIGVTGGSASGKTLFLQQLIKQVGAQNICFVSMDNYYKPRDEQPLDSQGYHNFDKPECFRIEDLLADVQKLLEGTQVIIPEYTFNNPSQKPRTLVFKPQKIIILEGIFVFYFETLRQLLNLKIFIDADEHLKLTRRIRRDQIERGYPLADVLYRYENHVAPNYNRFIKPYKQYADLVIQNNISFDNALEVVAGFIRNKINTL